MKISQFFYKAIVILLVIFLIILLGYGLWWLFSNYWAFILFYTYIFFTVVYCIFLLLGLFFANKFNNPVGQTFFLLRTIESRKKPNALNFWRNRTVNILEIISKSISFPSDSISELIKIYNLGIPRNQKEVLKTIAYETLYPTLPIKILISFCCLILICLVGSFDSFPQEYTNVLLTLMLVYAVLNILSFTLSPIDLVSRLRKGTRNSYLSFIIVGIFLYLIIVISLTSLMYGIQNITISEIFNISSKMFNLKETFFVTLKLFQGETISIIDYLISVIGLLYYISILKIFWSYRDFQRTNEDILATANAFLTFGKYNKTLEWLNKISGDFKQHLVSKGIAYLGVNQLQKAFESFQQHFIVNENTQVGEERIYRELLSSSMFYPISNSQILQLVSNLLNSNVKDANLTSTIYQIISDDNIFLLEKIEDMFLLPEVKNRFPLTEVSLKILVDDLDQAKYLLQQIAPTDGIDEVLRSIFVLLVNFGTTDNKNDYEVLETWIQNHLPNIEEIITTVSDEEKLYASTHLNLILQYIKEISPTRVEEFQFVLSEINSSITKEELKRVNYHLQSNLTSLTKNR